MTITEKLAAVRGMICVKTASGTELCASCGSPAGEHVPGCRLKTTIETVSVLTLIVQELQVHKELWVSGLLSDINISLDRLLES